jgi:hypothetical protein
MKSFTKDNDGYGYLLLAIDVFSHYMRTFPLTTTQGRNSFVRFEWRNVPRLSLSVKKTDWPLYSGTLLPCCFSVSLVYFRPEIFCSKRRFHRFIKMAPRAVTKNDEPRLWKLQYGPRVKLDRKSSTRFTFKKGDTGRISHLHQPFDREYDERWTMEYFYKKIGFIG